jgi:hypothetical protein
MIDYGLDPSWFDLLKSKWYRILLVPITYKVFVGNSFAGYTHVQGRAVKHPSVRH